jgi:hypothetical protein
MPVSRTGARPLALSLSVLLAAACSDGNLTTPGANDVVTPDIGLTIRDEIEATVGALTLSTTLTPIGTTRSDGVTTPCVVSSTPGDADGDGVPDDATYVFTAPPCQFQGWRGGTVELVGQLQMQDPAPSSAGFGYDAALTQLRSRFTNAAKEITDVTRDGSRTLSGSVSSLLLTSDLRVVRNFAGKPDATMLEKWTSTYTPATPLQINGPLNSGTLSLTGTIGWTRGNENLSLVVTTPTPLEYDATCSDTVQRIKNGELHAAGRFADLDGFIRVRWNGCGREPSVGFGTE